MQKGQSTDCPSTKLDMQNTRLFPIVAIKGYSYVINLPANIKIDNIFHADCLQLALTNMMLGQIKDLPLPKDVKGHLEYHVACILASKVERGVLKYKADQEGFNLDNMYYVAVGFKNTPHKLQQYHNLNPDTASPPVRLATWLDAYKKDKEAEDQEDNNIMVNAGKPTCCCRKQGR